MNFAEDLIPDQKNDNLMHKVYQGTSDPDLSEELRFGRVAVLKKEVGRERESCKRDSSLCKAVGERQRAAKKPGACNCFTADTKAEPQQQLDSKRKKKHSTHEEEEEEEEEVQQQQTRNITYQRKEEQDLSKQSSARESSSSSSSYRKKTTKAAAFTRQTNKQVQ
jgi:hypothetical protein